MEIRLRHAEENDAHLLLQWRNDPTTAKNSINQNPITWEDHKAWLDASLKREDRHIMIGVIGEDHPIGTIRFDKLIDGYEVSIIIEPYLRTSGMGKTLLRKGIELFGNNDLFATIRGDNVASLIIFLSSGFKLVEYNQSTGLAYLKREPR